MHAVCWSVGRQFGFQAFNVNPLSAGLPKKQFVPATIFVVSDHLVSLLVKNVFMRQVRSGAACSVAACVKDRLASHACRAESILVIFRTEIKVAGEERLHAAGAVQSNAPMD